MNNALKKINARVKQLQKKHPKKKRTTLQKQAGKEWKAGKLRGAVGSTKKKARKKTSTAKPRKRSTTKRKTTRKRAKRVVTVVASSVVGRVRRARKRRTTKKTTTRRRRVGSKDNSSFLTIAAIVGLGLLAWKFLTPSTSSQLPPVYYSNNSARNNATNNILAYATAGTMTIAAITALINALNNMSDDDVIRASSNPQANIPQIVGPSVANTGILVPTGGPGINI